MSASMPVSDAGQTIFYRDFTIIRALFISPVALLTTGFLIWGMERLIHSAPIAVDEAPVYEVPNPVLVERQPPPVIYDKPERPAELEPEPAIPPMAFTPDPTGPGDIVRERNVVKTPRGPISFSADVPIATMLMQPDYPARAANRGIEGFVDVAFDVAASGATQNVKVIYAEPERIFDSAAIKAVMRWKFQPAEKAGKPISFKGMEHRIVFQMGQST